MESFNINNFEEDQSDFKDLIGNDESEWISKSLASVIRSYQGSVHFGQLHDEEEKRCRKIERTIMDAFLQRPSFEVSTSVLPILK